MWRSNGDRQIRPSWRGSLSLLGSDLPVGRSPSKEADLPRDHCPIEPGLTPRAIGERSLARYLVQTVRPNTGELSKAATFHFGFESIHPFADGNGRVGRLAMNVLLAHKGFPMLNIAYGRRRGYYAALEESNRRENSRPFLRWFFLRYSRDLRFYLREL